MFDKLFDSFWIRNRMGIPCVWSISFINFNFKLQFENPMKSFLLLPLYLDKSSFHLSNNGPFLRNAYSYLCKPSDLIVFGIDIEIGSNF